MRKKIENALIEMGIYPNLKGFGYICEAVEILENNNRDMKIVDGVYREISEKIGVTKLSVERAIRHAITKADRKGEAFKKYIGIENATNAAFLHTLALRMKEEDF